MKKQTLNQRRNTLNVRFTIAGILMVALAFFVVQTTNTQAASPLVVFNANAATLGVIPDATVTGPRAPGAARDVTFTVAGVTGNVTNIAVTMTFGPAHTFAGDVCATLIAPNGTTQLDVFCYVGAATATSFGSGAQLAGPYTFSDAATGSFWSAATAAGSGVNIASGTYRTSTRGGVSTGGTATSLNTTFAGTAANGTWTLRFTDGAGGDTGGVSAASLDITGATQPPVAFQKRPLDFNGDNKTDYVVVRSASATAQSTWFIHNQTAIDAKNGQQWGLGVGFTGATTDIATPGDYDNDNKTDFAVWRPSATQNNSIFYILRSSNNTIQTERFGQQGDDPTIVGDYDGDGSTDVAVFRGGAAAGQPSFWFYRPSGTAGADFRAQQWGQNGDFPNPGDFNGDGRYDFSVQRQAATTQASFLTLFSNGGTENVAFGLPTDVIVPGDYDGDGKTDYATVRTASGNRQFNIRSSANGSASQFTFGASATDFIVQGDYTGDGRTDIAVWRSNATVGQPATFFVLPSGGTTFTSFQWGQSGDFPPAAFNQH